ncbi:MULTISPECIES: LPS export ABC transporter periplasmic protein LptC [Rhizobium]|uniref:LPS export ABC transporter periplasmic protein LptC n=1 Tax=Rhizobium rhododendri TaxID=2506430 RepID=A0ABY8IIH1_9HYPH|nr:MULTISPECIES: LPS export ABC transporter periplasmic protein LptC [Rhizobium]MBO9097077.1 LPS export ABC transporter periplasmic protein LptC [Rhizobium sp. L58/93]MBO9134071.1 LPS export ABC transporter periplasmic protein LptC [Rhizobium sp. B209b/85]MBO9167315.1 LPS export ABC transporter periplasmic protein LptC [Rhizobium sp. L245/93]MBO9183274.1 LPS export ABC transporter periplasmic protein LptC [Rhizobium sp. E27B/91]MBZ5759807.1 LPS export ABC transporter periplasmic protein LptC [
MSNTAESTGPGRQLTPELRAYDAAVANSGRVRRLKILLPIAAVIISLIFITVSVVRAYMPENISIQGASIEDGKIVMQRPAIAGRNSDGINYSMLAEKALQDIKNPNLITLKNIKAAMPVSDGVAHVTALSGDFDRAADTMKLTEPFTVTLDNGLRAEFKGAFLDIKGGSLVTQQPVAIFKGLASIVAQSLKMTDKGNVIEFDGQVKMHIDASTIHNTGS